MTDTEFNKTCRMLEVNPTADSEKWAEALPHRVLMVHEAVSIDDLRLLANAVGVLIKFAAMSITTGNHDAFPNIMESAATIKTLVVVMAEAKGLTPAE